MTRILAIFLWPLALIVFACGIARADIGGDVPSPGGCDYPFMGAGGAAFGEYDSFCQGPLEENGSRWTQILAGGMWQVQAGVGVGIGVVNANIGVTTPAGVLRQITYYACPGGEIADWPNPPGAWKAYLVPRKCKPVAPKPVLAPDDPPAPMFGPAPPPPPPLPPAPIGPAQLPNQTNPVAPAPFQQEDHH